MILARWRPALLLGIASYAIACEPPDPALVPDAELQTALGLDENDRVFTIGVSTGAGERADPDSVFVERGDFVQFVSRDWFVHEITFDLDSLSADARAFLEGSRQAAAPPLLQRDARFVFSAVDAPPGRYPFSLEGNREPGRGVIVVAPPGSFP